VTGVQTCALPIYHVTLRGKIVTGMGEGGYYITQKPYMDQFQGKLDFRPYEGTLNVKVSKEDLGKLEVIRSMPGHVIDGFEKDGRTFGKVIAYKAKIHNIDCAIVIPTRSHYNDTLELVCKYHLRRTLSISDGDEVDVVVDLSPLSSENQISCMS
jgi:riboflavin kinase